MLSDSYLPWRSAFAEVIDPRFYSLEWLDEEIASGRARCWANDHAAIVATLRAYPTGAVEVHGLIAAGALEAIKNLIPLAERWGCEEGAIVASIASRAAWTRALRDDGYLPWQVELRKDLSGGIERRQHNAEIHTEPATDAGRQYADERV